MRGYLILIIILVILPTVVATDIVVVNSEDWHDVYTGIIYAKLKGLDVHYIVEKTQGLQLIEEVLPKYKREVLLIESEKPIVFGYQSLLEGAGFSVEKYVSNDYQNTNLHFAEKAEANKYIIVDGSLGYEAVSVAPYALLTNSFVIFADNKEASEVSIFLEREKKDILLYGRIESKVKNQLASLSSAIINSGDLYEDNFRIVRKFMEEKSTKQVYLTTGEIIEPGLFNNEFPVLFIGTDRVPENVLEFIKETDIRTGIVVGYELFSNSKEIRDKTGIKILLKYGQGRNSQLYALDVFPLPKYDPQIEISKIDYNSLTKQLEVTYKNAGDVYAVVQAISHTIKSDNLQIREVGDENTFFFNKGDFKTVLYNVDLTDYLDTTITVESLIAYGSSSSSLTKLLGKKGIEVNIIAVEDSSNIKVKGVVYNKNTERFEVVIQNIGNGEVYVDPEIDLIVADEELTLGGDQNKILPGKKEVFKIKISLEENDFEDNKDILLRVRYGERKDVLLKTITKRFDFVVKKYDYRLLVLIAIIIIIISLIIKIKDKKRGRGFLAS